MSWLLCVVCWGATGNGAGAGQVNGIKDDGALGTGKCMELSYSLVGGEGAAASGMDSLDKMNKEEMSAR
jgi:hypothetical protein